MTRVAVVVQRCHESVVGGSEALAWQYARMLSGHHEVEVLTSTATEHVLWSNTLAAGADQREGIMIRRFPIALGRTPYWEALYRRLIDDEVAIRADGNHWREALQDEFIRSQGPYCPDLHAWLQAHAHGYDAVVFCTYLYSTTYFGIRAIAPGKAILVPTLHDEVAACLSVFRRLYARYRNRIWLTHAERRVASRLWGCDAGSVLGMAVNTELAAPERRARPYLLYCGRIEAGKGCDELLRAFERLAIRGRVSLVLTGADHLGLPSSPDIEFLGFVDEARKRALMAGASAFVLPSRYESFSIVALEAMAQGTPLLVNGQSEVMLDHIERSGGGLHYDSFDDMILKMERLCLLDTDARARIGAAGRDYVLANYHEERIRAQLCAIVEHAIVSGSAQRTGSRP
jgi:glycosyltransferase involved in cell wall biosynthesis